MRVLSPREAHGPWELPSCRRGRFYGDACGTRGREGPGCRPTRVPARGCGSLGFSWPQSGRIPLAPRRLTGSRPPLSRSPAAPVPAPREAPMLDGPLTPENRMLPSEKVPVANATVYQDPKPRLPASLVPPRSAQTPGTRWTLTCTGSQSASPPTARPSASPRWTPAGDAERSVRAAATEPHRPPRHGWLRPSSRTPEGQLDPSVYRRVRSLRPKVSLGSDSEHSHSRRGARGPALRPRPPTGALFMESPQTASV